MRTLICYLTSVVGAFALGGLMLGLQTLWGLLQLWLWLSIALATAPLFLLSLIVYAGGFYGALETIFPSKSKAVAPAADA